MTDWRHISTAPRDGTEFLVCDADIEGGFQTVVYYDESTSKKRPLVVKDAGISYSMGAFTHWTHLLKLPQAAAVAVNPKPCPFCGAEPAIRPEDPETDGAAWGEVRCMNQDCAAKPSVRDGVTTSDDRGSAAYKEAAIERWNRRGATND